MTCAHPGQVADFTIADEYVPHAVAAAGLLRDHPAVDAARVFVAGHSAGGKAAPRVAAADPAVAGLVILAGDTQPMHQAAVRVARYLAALDPGPAAEAFAEAITRQAALAGSPACRQPRPPPSCRSASRPRTGWTCGTTTRSPPRRRWTSRCSSCRAAATSR